MNDILRRQAEARQRQAKDTWFDSLITELPRHRDTHECEKGSIFCSARPLVYAAIAIAAALFFAITG